MGDENRSSFINPGDTLTEGDWLYSSNGNYRWGVRDGRRMVTERVDSGTIVSSGDQTNGAAGIRLATIAAAMFSVEGEA